MRAVRLTAGASPPNEDLLNRRRRKSAPGSYCGDKGGQRIQRVPPSTVVDIEIVLLESRTLTLLQDNAPLFRNLPRGIKVEATRGAEN